MCSATNRRHLLHKPVRLLTQLIFLTITFVPDTVPNAYGHHGSAQESSFLVVSAAHTQHTVTLSADKRTPAAWGKVSYRSS